MKNQNEAFSRILIDRLLEKSGWNLTDSSQVKFESSGSSGRADYLLMGQHGPLCVLEAKNPHCDPYDAKEQARKYAEETKAPFIILSNGKEHWFWNYQLQSQQDAYRIERLPSRNDLEWLRQRNLNPPDPLFRALEKTYFSSQSEDILLRGYQIKATETIAKQFDQGKRSFLIEMATGTGKTVLAATMIRRFLETRNAARVLFIVDRIEPAKQAMEKFKQLLPDYSPVLYKEVKNKPNTLWGSCIVVATIQSLMTGRRFQDDFTPFHFDLVINDEAHRSIYGDSRECVQYFQAVRIGLTATPKAYLKNVNIDELEQNNPKSLEARLLRDTYNFFGCEPGTPSFRYDLIEAVNDPEGPFLCLPKIWDLRSDITTKSLEENGWTIEVNGEEETFKIADLERKVFTPMRNELMCQALLQKAMKSPDGKLGKTIIFAVNQKHATTLTKILNACVPGIAATITSNVRDSSSIAKQFRKGERSERIAVTVDMLSTGYDCSDVINIALMRPIFSPIQYLQIKGRGTRLHTWDLEDKKYKKDNFAILDFCAVSEYFDDKYDYTSPLPIPGSGKKRTGGGGIFTDPPPPTPPEPPKEIPVWTGIDELISEEVKIIGPNGEKVDILTFRGAFERDIREFSDEDPEFQQAVKEEDDDKVEEILQERFFNRPEMFYSPAKLIKSYGVPGTPVDFVYHALNKRELSSNSDLLQTLGNSLATKNNLNYRETKWIAAITQAIADSPDDLESFVDEDPYLYERAQFRSLGGINQLQQSPRVLSALAELRKAQAIQKMREAQRQQR